jgi:PAS domain S-box-containing protein
LTGRDPTHRKPLEEALRESEERLRLALEAGGVGTFDWDFNTHTARCSEEYFHIMRAAPQESNSVTFAEWLSWVHPEDRKRIVDELGVSLVRESESAGDYRIVRADGQTRWISYRGRITRNAVGEPSRMLGAVLDITERKWAEEELRRLTTALRAKVDELSTLLDILPGPVLMADPQCRRITGNRACYEMLGLPQGANASLTAEQPDLPAGVRVFRDGRELRPEEFPMQATGLTGRRITDFDHDLVFPDGRVITLLANTAPLLDEHGNVRGVVGSYMDISERKRAETALRDREARLAAILNTATDAIITINHKGIIQSVNAAAERLFGYTAAETIGQNVQMLMPSPYREQHDRYLERYLQSGKQHIMGIGREVEGQRKDGSIFPMELALSEVGHLKLFTGFVRDISRRKELEREVVEVASQEQRRIGQDLHDSVSQELTALSMIAGGLVEALQSDPAQASRLAARLVVGLQRSQQELRAVMRGLLPVSVDAEGLMAALSDLAQRTQQEGKVRCGFDCPNPILVADNLVATQLYLIAQEAARNAVKHARCTNISISVRADHCLRLRVQDDGIGLTSRMTEDHGGLGLRVMRNRAAIIGATLTIEPAKPAGTVVTCALTRRNHEP